MSWFPDPDATAIDAFTCDWSKYFFYAFPPFSLILRVLTKIENEGGRGVVVVPDWANQAWYPKFKALAKSRVIYLGPANNLLSSPNRCHQPLHPSLRLMAAVL